MSLVTPHSFASSAPVSAGGAMHVCILLGLYNGAAFLSDQLDSLERQTHGDWSLIVSDDGSTDDGPALIARHQRLHPHRPVTTQCGPRKGWAANFLSLLNQVDPEIPFAAFCDQDDVWLPGKLTRALDTLQRVPAEIPALYCGCTLVADEALKGLRLSARFTRPPSFANALVQSIAGGNTMVMNRAAIGLMQKASPYAGGIVSHDWWAYQIISGAGGRVLYDADPMVIYRQHADNLVGANLSMRAKAFRLWCALRGRYSGWNAANIRALSGAAFLLSPSAQASLAAFAAMKDAPFLKRMKTLGTSRLYRQTRSGTVSLWLAAALGKL